MTKIKDVIKIKNKKNTNIFLFLLLIIIFVNSVRFIQSSGTIVDEQNTSFDLDGNTLEKLKISSGMSSPLLWYSQTEHEVQAVAISSDGNYSISGSKSMSKNLIALYHKNNSVPLWEKDDLNGEVFSVDISANGSYMVAGTGYGFGEDITVYLFEKKSPTPVWSYQLGNIVFSVAISSDGNYIVAGSKDDRVYLFHKSSSTPIWNFQAGDHISSVAISSEGKYIVVGSGDHKIYFFERSSSTPLWSHTIDYIPGHMGDVESVSISSDGSYIAAVTQIYQGTSKVYLFHRSSSTPLWKYSAGDYLNSVSIDSEGNYIVAGGRDNKVYVFHRSSSTPLWSYTTGDSVNSVSISADGNYIVSGGGWNDKSVYLFNKTSNIPLWKYETTNYINSVSISANGRFSVAGGSDKNVYLFKSNGSQKHITLYADADNPDTNAEFNLYWNTFINPEHIWIYESNHFIGEINESVTLIDTGNALNNPYRISGLLNGSYYYKIKINNSVHGEIYSNCIKVNIYLVYNLIWSRLYGDDGTQGGFGVCVDSLNNIYQTGYIMDGPHGRNDGIVIKSSNSGVQLWNKTFGRSDDDIGLDICVDSNDDIYVVGKIDSHPIDHQDKIILLKYNSTGDCYWNRTWYDMSRANGRSIAIDSEDNIYVAGYAGDIGTTDLVFIKYNSEGSKIWQRIWGGSGYEGRYGLKIAIDSQDHLYIAAQTNSFGAGDSDAVLIKYDKFGNQIWNKTWGGVSIDGAEAITIDSNDDIFIAGYTDSYSTNGRRNLFLAKYNDSGILIWNKTWEGLGSAFCKDMTVDSNNNVILTGTTNEDMPEFVFLLMYDNSCKLLWNTLWGDEMSMMNQGSGICIDSFDNIYVSGYADYYEGHNGDIFLLKYSQLLIPEPFLLYTNAGLPDIDGIFDLIWIKSDKANNYSIYVYDKYITEINSSLTLLSDMMAVSPYGINAINGTYYYIVVAHNNYGDAFSNCIEIVVQTLDNVAPNILINNPTPNGLFGFEAPSYNITLLEGDLDSIWYRLNNETIVTYNITINYWNGYLEQDSWDQLGNGTITISFYANDSAGNIGQASVNVQKDVLGPIINITTPLDNSFFGFNAPQYDLSIVEFNLDSMWYSLDYGVTIVPIYSLTGTIDQVVWETKGSGTVPIRFYANDSLGHESFTDVTIIKDLINPLVTINYPDAEGIFGDKPPDYGISIIENNLKTYWYTLDGGTTNITITSLTGTINQAEWDKHGNGSVNLQFFAEDEGGNEGFAEILVKKDINLPLITINSPELNDIVGFQSPTFDIIVVEPNIDAMWYTLDGGMTTYSFTEFTGQIDDIEWDKFGHGTVLIQFHVRDKAGNEAFAEVQVNKDLIAPIITINAPLIGTVFEDYSPIYSISIEETNLKSYWYSLDGGTTNFTISELTGVISESAWNDLPNGHVTLTFYASDEGGNIGQAPVIITKNTTETPGTPPPGIPGYNLIALLGVTLAVTLILTKRKLKK